MVWYIFRDNFYFCAMVLLFEITFVQSKLFWTGPKNLGHYAHPITAPLPRIFRPSYYYVIQLKTRTWRHSAHSANFDKKVHKPQS